MYMIKHGVTIHEPWMVMIVEHDEAHIGGQWRGYYSHTVADDIRPIGRLKTCIMATPTWACRKKHDHSHSGF